MRGVPWPRESQPHGHRTNPAQGASQGSSLAEPREQGCTAKAGDTALGRLGLAAACQRLPQRRRVSKACCGRGKAHEARSSRRPLAAQPGVHGRPCRRWDAPVIVSVTVLDDEAAFPAATAFAFAAAAAPAAAAAGAAMEHRTGASWPGCHSYDSDREQLQARWTAFTSTVSPCVKVTLVPRPSPRLCHNKDYASRLCLRARMAISPSLKCVHLGKAFTSPRKTASVMFVPRSFSACTWHGSINIQSPRVRQTSQQAWNESIAVLNMC